MFWYGTQIMQVYILYILQSDSSYPNDWGWGSYILKRPSLLSILSLNYPTQNKDSQKIQLFVKKNILHDAYVPIIWLYRSPFDVFITQN